MGKSPSSPSTALHCFPVYWVEGQLEINWVALHYIISYGSDIAAKEMLFVSSSSLLEFPLGTEKFS